MTVIKDVSGNFDAGTASQWGGNNIMVLDNYLDDIDVSSSIVNGTGAVRINTPTRFRSTKFILRDSGNDHNYIFATGDIAANRTVSLPVITADDTFAMKGIDNSFTAGQKITISGSDVLTLNRNTSSVGFGPNIRLHAQDSAAAEQEYARIRCEIADNTAGAEYGDLLLQVTRNGSNQQTLAKCDGVSSHFLCGGINLRVKLSEGGLTGIRTITFPNADSLLFGNGVDNSLGAHYLDVGEITTPANPAANTGRIFFDSADEVLKIKKSGGTVVDLEASGTGAPTGAQYVTLATDGTLTAERVATSGDGISLTDGGAGGNLTISRDIIDEARKRVCFVEDCFVDFNGASDSFIFERSQSGTGALLGGASTNSQDNRFGLWQFDTGTTATGYATMVAGSFSSLVIGQGQITIEFLVQFPTLSTSTQEYIFRMGLIDSANGSGVDGVYFLYDRAASGDVWKAVTVNNSTSTNSASSTAVAAATWYRCKIIINAAGTSANFYVNGTELNISPISTNLPGNTRSTTFAGHLLKTVGTTSRTCLLDYYAADIDLTSSR